MAGKTSALLIFIGLLSASHQTDAFAPSQSTLNIKSLFNPTSKHTHLNLNTKNTNLPNQHGKSIITSSHPMKRSKNTKLNQSMNSNSFDLTKPVFDIFSLRSIRGDAILQYNSLNQSEPLRINLYLLLALSLLAFPTISEAVVGEQTTLAGTVASALGGVGSLGLFVRECGRRSNQLRRIEKELNAEFLKVKLPLNRFADRGVGGKTYSLKEVRGQKRVIAMCGNAKQLREALMPFRILRRRLMQASCVLVVVSTDSSTKADWGLSEDEVRSAQWLAEAVDLDSDNGWLNYFQTLQSGNESGAAGNNKLIWFGLTNNGRSFGSGVGEVPRLIEILGQNLLPVEVLDEEDNAVKAGNDVDKTDVVDKILDAQKRFYDALTGGDLLSMNEILSNGDSNEVSEVLDGGGRVDKWDLCLAEGARPSDMTISGSDVLLVSDTEAYSTTVEFPPNAGLDGATLLAVQRWKYDENGNWKLALHQTIPWCPGSKAGGTLRCDCRGCTALTSTRERRTFGGLIG